MHLIADFGNTTLKYFLFDKRADIIVSGTFHPKIWKTEVANLISNYPINAILFSDVRGIAQGIGAADFQGVPVFHTTAKLHLPFTTAYHPPEQLGADRIGLLAAACVAYPKTAVLIIDAGSCITFDYMDAQAHHHGGAITLGLKMRYRSLHEHTGKLPLLPIKKVDEITGTSTAQAIHAGIFLGVVSEIQAQIDAYKQKTSDLTIILTGGDAPRLLKQLKNTIFASSNFLAEGLNYILEINKKLSS